MDSKFVFDLGTVDLSDGHAAMATLAGDDAPMPLETAAWAPELAGPLGFPSFTVSAAVSCKSGEIVAASP